MKTKNVNAGIGRAEDRYQEQEPGIVSTVAGC
jgi:hypothetical protein